MFGRAHARVFEKYAMVLTTLVMWRGVSASGMVYGAVSCTCVVGPAARGSTCWRVISDRQQKRNVNDRTRVH